MVKRIIEQNLRIKNFEARNGNYERNAVVKSQGTKQREQRTLGYCWQWKANGQCSEGENCSFRHDINKRAKSTQLNPSPSSFMQQNERNASRTRSPRGKSPSGRMSRWPCKDFLKGTCNNSFVWKVTPSRMLVLQDREWMSIRGKVLIRTSSGWRTAKQKVQKEWWQKCSSHVDWRRMSITIEQGDLSSMLTQIHGNWVAYSRIWSRRSLHQFYGRAQTYGIRCVKIHESRCLSHWHSRPKILRSEWFAQVNPISRSPNAPKFEDRSQEETEWQEKVPMKQHGGWPKVFLN